MQNFDDALNGADAAPRYGNMVDINMPQKPSDVGPAAASGNPKAVMYAWLALLGVLVLAHVLTLKVQK